MIVDGHSHITFSVEEHIREMEQAGVDKTVLFSTTFHPEHARNASEVKQEMQYLNDLLAGKKGSMLEARKNSIKEIVTAVEQFPKHFIGFGAVPAGLSLEETNQYMEENIIKNHLAGIGEFTLGSGQAHLLQNVFAASHEWGNLPIWIHAFYPFTLQDIKDTAAYAAEYPDIPVILGHLGGGNWIETMELAAQNPNIYIDTSAYYSTLILRTVINEIPQKCIFGVDRPFGDLELSKQGILKCAGTEAVARAVLGENIAQILKI